jgi:hypothetical protein
LTTFRAIISCAIPNTPNPCYTTFCYNVPYQFTPPFYLRPFFLGLTHFGWFIRVCFFLMGIYYLIYAQFFMNATRAQNKILACNTNHSRLKTASRHGISIPWQSGQKFKTRKICYNFSHLKFLALENEMKQNKIRYYSMPKKKKKKSFF